MNSRALLPALLAVLPVAAAHDTVNAGNVSVEWHTDTNEFLQAEGDSILTLAFRVAEHPLNAAECRCTLLLYAGGVSPRVKPTVLKWTAGQDGTLNTRISVNEPGRYSVVVDGKPLDVKRFAPFRLTLRLDAVEDVYNAPPPPAPGTP